MAYRKNINSPKIMINGREISNTSKTFIIAEAACNHMCNLKMAKKMIKEAKAAGADAIKFQTHKAERLVCKDTPTYWKYPGGAKSQFEYYKRLDKFGRRDYEVLFNYAKKTGIIAFSTPFDIQSATMLDEIGMPIFKIASCDLVDTRLLRHVAKFKKPIILSTGAGTLGEIKNAVSIILNSGNPDLILMVCTLSYPARDEDANLRRILSFRKSLPNLIIGLSDHTQPDANMVIPAIAVSLGARVVEKHFTLDRNMTGSGHSFSIESDDLKKMVQNIRLTEVVLGNNRIGVYESELAARRNARRSLVANRDIKKGEKINDAMVGIKRPGSGLSPELIDLVVGKIAKVDIKEDSQINFSQLASGSGK